MVETIHPDEYRGISQRLARFAMTSRVCGWPNELIDDMSKAAVIVEFLADALDEKNG